MSAPLQCQVTRVDCWHHEQNQTADSPGEERIMPRVTTNSLAIATALALLVSGPVAAADPAIPCADEKSHQFDFWIGEWDVMAGGKQAGTNSIQPILDGCVLQETWSGARGSAGSSFNFYNPTTGKWHQFWVWRNGTTLDVAGEYKDGKMLLVGDGKSRDGKTIRNRITWHDNPDGTVRQHWEKSIDGGKTWKTSFDGLYKKKS